VLLLALIVLLIVGLIACVHLIHHWPLLCNLSLSWWHSAKSLSLTPSAGVSKRRKYRMVLMRSTITRASAF
jgi:hypothetical protein